MCCQDNYVKVFLTIFPPPLLIQVRQSLYETLGDLENKDLQLTLAMQDLTIATDEIKRAAAMRQALQKLERWGGSWNLTSSVCSCFDHTNSKLCFIAFSIHFTRVHKNGRLE